MTEANQVPPAIQKGPANQKKRQRGLINPDKVRALSFGVITLCIIISVFACVLSIWDFTTHDSLWRTVATCIVLAGGMMAFGVINALYGPQDR